MMQLKNHGFSFPEVLVSLLLVAGTSLLLLQQHLLVSQQINRYVQQAKQRLSEENQAERQL